MAIKFIDEEEKDAPKIRFLDDQPKPQSGMGAVELGNTEATKAMVEAQPQEEGMSMLEMGKTIAGGVARYAGKRIKDTYEGVVDSITGESKSSATTKFYPDVGGVMKNSPEYENLVKDAKANTYLINDAMLSNKGLLPPRDFETANRIEAIEMAADSKEEATKMYRAIPNAFVWADPETREPMVSFSNGYTGAVNSPGLSRTDIVPTAKRAGLFALTGGRAQAAKGGVNAINQMLYAAATQSGLEAVSVMAGGDYSKWEVGLAGMMEGLSRGVSGAIGKFMASIPPKARMEIKTWRDLKGKIPNDKFQEIKKIKEASEGLGAPAVTKVQFDMSKGQPALKEVDKFKKALKSIDDAEKIANEMYSQNVFAKQNIKKQISEIAAAGNPVETGSRMVKKASVDIIDDIKGNREAIAEAAYGKAFTNANNGMGRDVDLWPVRDFINNQLGPKSIFRGEEQKAFKQILNFMKRKDPVTGEVVDANYMTGRMAQKLKIEIDNIIRKRPDTSVGKTTEASVIRIKNELIDQIEATNPGFKNANKIYEKQTQGLDDVENIIDSLVGKTGEDNAIKLSRVFNSDDISSIKALKGMLDQKDPVAYHTLYKGWLTSKLESIPNIKNSNAAAADIFRTFFGTPDKIKRTMELAPSKAIKQNLTWLKDYTEQIKSINVSVSPSKGVVDVAIEGGRDTAVQGLASAAIKVGGKGWSKLRSDALSDAILNPRWAEQMDLIKSAKREKAELMLDRLLLIISNVNVAESTQADLGNYTIPQE